MAAIDLLFDHKANNERVHQVALSGLLLHTRLLERILGIPGLRAIELEWEPERRLYDLAFTVTEPSGTVDRVFVELKVDGALDKEQFDRQHVHVKKTPKSRLVYLVLGLSQVTVTDQRLAQWAGASAAATEGTSSHLWARCDANRLSELLADPAILHVSEVSKRRDVRDLAGSYRDVLHRLTDRTKHFAERPPSDWKAADFYGFFEDCRSQGIGHMGSSGISYEANPKGGFIACHWLWTPIHPSEPLRLYLQLEDAKLCLKLKVPDELKVKRKPLWDAAQATLRTLPPPSPPPQWSLAPTNYHSGVYTTFAAISDVFGAGPLDRAAFAEKLLAAEAILRAVAAKLHPVAAPAPASP